jgi:hypothetical protein
MVSGVGGLSSSEVVLGGIGHMGWWLVRDEHDGPAQIVAGPFADRADADWAAAGHPSGDPEGVRPVYGFRRADGGLDRRTSPQDRAWLAHLGDQLDRLPDDWDAGFSDDDPLVTLMVEVVAALSEAGLPVCDIAGAGEIGGAWLTPEPELRGIVVTWRQHDRMSVEQVHGPAPDVMVQQVMNRALAEVLQLRGFAVETFGGGSGHVVRLVA